ncbi:MAG: hypothetical protein ACFFBR_02995, partial [Promethearchaeota archaeon]
DEAFKYLTDFFEDQKEKGVIQREVNTNTLALGLIALQDGLQGYELFGMARTETGEAWSEISNILLRGVMANEQSATEYKDNK